MSTYGVVSNILHCYCSLNLEEFASLGSLVPVHYSASTDCEASVTTMLIASNHSVNLFTTFGESDYCRRMLSLTVKINAPSKRPA